jgi:uncharacterized protein YlbG (UPF0298 family)
MQRYAALLHIREKKKPFVMMYVTTAEMEKEVCAFERMAMVNSPWKKSM